MNTISESGEARFTIKPKHAWDQEMTAIKECGIELPPKAVPPRVLVQAPPFGWGVVQEAEVG